jgi:hypothetical protein
VREVKVEHQVLVTTLLIIAASPKNDLVRPVCIAALDVELICATSNYHGHDVLSRCITADERELKWTPESDRLDGSLSCTPTLSQLTALPRFLDIWYFRSLNPSDFLELSPVERSATGAPLVRYLSTIIAPLEVCNLMRGLISQ